MLERVLVTYLVYEAPDLLDLEDHLIGVFRPPGNTLHQRRTGDPYKFLSAPLSWRTVGIELQNHISHWATQQHLAFARPDPSVYHGSG